MQYLKCRWLLRTLNDLFTPQRKGRNPSQEANDAGWLVFDEWRWSYFPKTPSTGPGEGPLLGLTPWMVSELSKLIKVNKAATNFNRKQIDTVLREMKTFGKVPTTESEALLKKIRVEELG